MQSRQVIKIAGESGQGLNSIGEMFAKALKESGYFVFGYREYPSLIRGGYANYQLDFSDHNISSSSKYCDLAICLSRFSIHKILLDLNEGGTLIHWINRFKFDEEEEKIIENKKLKVVYIDALNLVEEAGGIKIMVNTFFTGFAWKLLGQDIKLIERIFEEKFQKKPEILEKNLEILNLGFGFDSEISPLEVKFEKNPTRDDSLLITGNHTLSLGAISAGMRAYYAYPMTPSSSILSYLASTYHETGVLVKQAEDEITAMQMTLGSMHMGTRALVATSGGGFALMTESVSMSAMNEIPLVCVIAQRPGPATGVPTWTAAGDLNLALYSGHGEFTRCVIAASDATSAYTTIQHAFNIAEKYQIPVMLLTEKQIAESLFNIDELPKPIKIERSLSDNDDGNLKRYELTDTGVSPRWLPGTSSQVYNSNSDEHFENGRLTEEADEIKLMMDKRLRKEKFLKEELPEPELYGEEAGRILFVGWGSVRNTVLDSIKLQITNDELRMNKVSYLHYEYLWPLKTKKLEELKDKFDKLVLIENNATGQLGKLIKQECGVEFDDRILKYDGRPFFVEEIWEYLD